MKNLLNENSNEVPLNKEDIKDNFIITKIKNNKILIFTILIFILIFIWQRISFSNEVKEAKSKILNQSWVINELEVTNSNLEAKNSTLEAPKLYLDNLASQRLENKTREENLRKELDNIIKDTKIVEMKIRCWREAMYKDLNCEDSNIYNKYKLGEF